MEKIDSLFIEYSLYEVRQYFPVAVEAICKGLLVEKVNHRACATEILSYLTLEGSEKFKAGGEILRHLFSAERIDKPVLILMEDEIRIETYRPSAEVSFRCDEGLVSLSVCFDECGTQDAFGVLIEAELRGIMFDVYESSMQMIPRAKVCAALSQRAEDALYQAERLGHDLIHLESLARNVEFFTGHD